MKFTPNNSDRNITLLTVTTYSFCAQCSENSRLKYFVSGKILTIETVPLKLPRRYWDGPEVDPDQTFFPDEYLRHILYITRIYFISGEPEEELIGKTN